MIGYKVVFVHNKQLWSVCKSFYMDNLKYGCTRYIINKSVRPKKDCGPFAVFDNLDDAEHFVIRNTARGLVFRIYMCKYKKSRLEKLYQYNGNEYSQVLASDCFSGTTTASSVTLLERVE